MGLTEIKPIIPDGIQHLSTRNVLNRFRSCDYNVSHAVEEEGDG